jgi:uncharacterized protein YciI
MANIKRLAAEGKLVAAGPFEQGGGMFILNTTSTAEANEWLSTDPGVQAKRWDIETFLYTPRIGSVCKAPEPYEMVLYSFIRFDAAAGKSPDNTYQQILKKHEEYIDQLAVKGNVITEGIFGEQDGGILVMKGEIEKSLFETDQAVRDGLLEVTLKQLFIAKGSFCEK